MVKPSFVRKNPFWKAIIDYGLTIPLVMVFFPFFIVLFLLASYDTGFPGVFTQIRIGQFGRPFTIYKLRTYHPKTLKKSNIGVWLRKTKLDELPQLFNILRGNMSIVGPRPDIPGYYDTLKGENRLILQLKPGLTSEAGLKFRNEEELLATKKNSLQYNDEVLFPEKVRMNLEYYHQVSLKKDLEIIFKTFFIL